MRKIQEVIVVEGKDDTKKIKRAVDADTIETNGSAIDQPILAQIKHAHEKRGVIVFTDPDFPGEKIRKTISQAIPGVKHAFLSKNEAQASKKGESLGIEHASIEAIQQALSGLYEEKTASINQEVEIVSKRFLMKQGLINQAGSKKLREQLGEELRIGYTNGKQLQKRLALFNIKEDEIVEALENIRREEEKNGRK